MKIPGDGLLTSALVLCAIVTTGLVVRRELFSRPTGPEPQSVQRPVFLENWRSYLKKGVQLGPSNSPVQLIEFTDYECPFCASFHATLKKVRREYPQHVALSLIHYPLPIHRFAEPAARAAECAGEQHRFEAMHDILFEQQRQIGLKSWHDFASEAGVPDLEAFASCIQRNDAVPRVTIGRALGEELEIRGTPTLIINGWKLTRPPSEDELASMVSEILSGRSPISDTGRIPD